MILQRNKHTEVSYLLICICCLIAIKGYSQELTGKVYNTKNDKTVSFANIGIPGKSVGTVSDEDGNFRMTIDSSHIHDSLRISCIGYYTKSYSIEELFEKSAYQEIVGISLDPREYHIQEATVKAKKAKTVALGNPIRDNDRCKLRTDSHLGSEMGLIIHLPKKGKRYLLKDFTFNLSDHDFETEVRINIYNINNSIPSENILREAIYLTIPANMDIMTIDLLKYTILLDEDFFISIEHFKRNLDLDNRLKFNCVLVNNANTGCYSRKASQGDWTKIENVGVQFKIGAYVQE